MRVDAGQKKRKKETNKPGEGWEDGTPPPHRDFEERRVWLGKTALGALGVQLSAARSLVWTILFAVSALP